MEKKHIGHPVFYILDADGQYVEMGLQPTPPVMPATSEESLDFAFTIECEVIWTDEAQYVFLVWAAMAYAEYFTN